MQRAHAALRLRTSGPTRYSPRPPYPRDSQWIVYRGKTWLRRSTLWRERTGQEQERIPRPPANSKIVSAVNLRYAHCGLLR